MALTSSQFIELARSHGFETVTAYKGAKRDIILQHEAGLQVSCTPNEFVRKFSTFKNDEPTNFYLQRITKSDLVFYKYGITTRDIESRILEQNRVSNAKHELIMLLKFENGRNCLTMERDIKMYLDRFHLRHTVAKEVFPDGYTETCFERHLHVIQNVKRTRIGEYEEVVNTEGM